MLMSYDVDYKKNSEYFGKDADELLQQYAEHIDREFPVLDIGAGQGRNTLYLLNRGFQVIALEPSTTGCQQLMQIQNSFRESLLIEKKSFQQFNPPESSFSAICLFGILQILSWTDIDSLKEKIELWLQPGGLLFITAFTVNDESFHTIEKDSKVIGKNSFKRENGEIFTYFEENELAMLFSNCSQLFYKEFVGPYHCHGKGPEHRHAFTWAVFQSS